MKSNHIEMANQNQLPDHETFYRLLTSHQDGLVGNDEQQSLAASRVLIAGCGAIGSRVARHLVSSGIEHFCLLDDDIITEQQFAHFGGGYESIGQNMACLVAGQIQQINPFATASTYALADFSTVASTANLIIDTLGIEHLSDFADRLRLHDAAHALQIPVVSGFNVGSSVWAFVHDYANGHSAVLGGAYGEAELEADPTGTAVPVLLRMMSLSKSQPEVLRETERILIGQRESLPHSVPASGMAGSLVSQAAIDVLLERPVRESIALDLEGAVQPSGGLRRTGRRLAALYSLRRHLRHRRRAGTVGVFTPLEDHVFLHLRPYMEERTYEAGSVVIRQGDGADEFFVILEGRVDVEFEERDADDQAQNYTVIAELGPGDYFGEMALLTDTPRAASVVVVERCRVLALSRGAFEIYLEESDTADKKVRGEALARIRDNSGFIGC